MEQRSWLTLEEEVKDPFRPFMVLRLGVLEGGVQLLEHPGVGHHQGPGELGKEVPYVLGDLGSKGGKAAKASSTGLSSRAVSMRRNSCNVS